jgi:hypothetical protein
MKTKNIFGLFSILLLFLSIVPLASAANVDVALQWVVDGKEMGADKEIDIDVDETVSYQVAANSFAKYNLEVILLDENKDVVDTLLELPGLNPSDANPDWLQTLNFVPENDDTTYYIQAIAYTTNGNSNSKDELQLNVNKETVPEVCADHDEDGICDKDDNCVVVDNPDQENNDDDNYGDVCDSDDDNDGFKDDVDNCPKISNPGQEDNENDGLGDVCDDNDDNDGFTDDGDQCPFQVEDMDGYQDDDGCPEVGSCDDLDEDGVCDDVDNCNGAKNPTQSDLDNDGKGDFCDEDIDGDGINNAADDCSFEAEDFDGIEDEDGCPEDAENNAPHMSITGETQINEMETLSLNINVNDEEKLALRVKVKECLFTIPNPFGNSLCVMPSYEDVPEEVKLSKTSMNEFVLTWNTDYTFVKHPAQSKTETLVFIVDDTVTETKEEVKVTIKDVNQLTVLTSEGDELIAEGETFFATFVAEDADPEDVFEFNVIKPDWVSYHIVSGKEVHLAGTADCSTAGDYDIAVTVNDGVETVSEHYTFTVTEACEVPCEDHDNDGVCNVDDLCPAKAGTIEEDGCPLVEEENHLPHIVKITDKTVVEGNLLQFDFGVSDIDGDDFTVTAGSRWPKTVTVYPKPLKLVDDSIKFFIFNWQTAVGEVGDHYFTIVAKDINGGTSSQKIKVTVLEKPVCLDSDADGICDDVDLCPLVAEDFDGIEDTDGCPEEEPCLDSDADGICDDVDVCPLEAEDFDGIEDTDGCPEEEPCLDSDADGICDDIDVCPLVAEDFDGIEDTDGCPEEEPVVNHAPIVLSNPITSATENVKYVYQFKAVDPDGDVIAFTLAEAPSGMTMTDDGLVKWTPESGKTQAKVVIAVTDGEFIVKQQFNIGIKGVYQNVKLASVQLAMEEVMVGDYLSAQVKVVNNGNQNMDDLKISMIIPELGLKKSASEFDLKPGQNKNKNLNLQIPYYAEAGEYLVKVSVSNGGFHEQTYRLLTIY